MKNFKRLAPVILTFLSGAGLVTTTIITIKATPKAVELIEAAEKEKNEDLTITEKLKTVWKVYIPTAICGFSTLICIFSINVLNKKNQASLISAYTFLEQSYKDYKRKNIELYGKENDNRIEEALAIEKTKKQTISAEYFMQSCDLSTDENCSKPILFYERYSDRFFTATIEQVLSAEYHLNRNYILRGDNNINELYSFLGLETTEWGDDFGWIPTDESEYWIEFNHIKSKLDNGDIFYILEMPFAPTSNYIA